MVLIGDALAGVVSRGEIDRAAESLVSRCASHQGVGSVSRPTLCHRIPVSELTRTRIRLGGDNRVAIILGTYQPNIECRGSILAGINARISSGICWPALTTGDLVQ